MVAIHLQISLGNSGSAAAISEYTEVYSNILTVFPTFLEFDVGRSIQESSLTKEEPFYIIEALFRAGRILRP
jgi:hypothetical protein